MLDISCTRIRGILILHAITAVGISFNIKEANFILIFIIIKTEVPAARASQVINVLHPFLNTCWIADECIANITHRNLVV